MARKPCLAMSAVGTTCATPPGTPTSTPSAIPCRALPSHLHMMLLDKLVNCLQEIVVHVHGIVVHGDADAAPSGGVSLPSARSYQSRVPRKSVIAPLRDQLRFCITIVLNKHGKSSTCSSSAEHLRVGVPLHRIAPSQTDACCAMLWRKWSTTMPTDNPSQHPPALCVALYKLNSIAAGGGGILVIEQRLSHAFHEEQGVQREGGQARGTGRRVTRAKWVLWAVSPGSRHKVPCRAESGIVQVHGQSSAHRKRRGPAKSSTSKKAQACLCVNLAAPAQLSSAAPGGGGVQKWRSG